MGMFDYVNFRMPCPKCGKEVGDFQTKSTECTMRTVDPTICGCFYSRCDACKTWIEFDREVAVTPPRPEPFTVSEVLAMGFTMTEPQ